MDKKKGQLTLAVVIIVVIAIIAGVYYTNAISIDDSIGDDYGDSDIPSGDDTEMPDDVTKPGEKYDFSKFIAPVKPSFSKGDHYTYEITEDRHVGLVTTAEENVKITSANSKKQIYTIEYNSPYGSGIKSDISRDEVLQDFWFDINNPGEGCMRMSDTVGGLPCYIYTYQSHDGNKEETTQYIVNQGTGLLVLYIHYTTENNQETYHYERALISTSMLLA